MIQAVTPHMMETLEGTIVNVESITALILCSQYLNQIFEKLNISTKLILKKTITSQDNNKQSVMPITYNIHPTINYGPIIMTLSVDSC